MVVIAVCSLKGGVGKTSVTLGMTSAAREAGLRTLVVDLDPQGDSTAGLDIEDEVTSSSALVIEEPRRRNLRAATRRSHWSEGAAAPIDVVVGGLDLARLDRTDLSSRGLTSLRTVLDKVDDEYDLVIVDCPPSLGGLTRIGLAAADRAVIVTEPGVFAIAAADRALRAVHEVRTSLAPRLQPLGIVINRVRAHIGEHQYRVEELTSLFGPLVLSQHIPERTSVQRAQGAYAPIHAFRGSGAREVAGLFDGILAHALRAARRTAGR
ncbi:MULTISPECIES: ParA family protein [Janibacter]|uniref:ParA family protein n=1 Tax=Janibacter TaxID=53457 RepID=UPI000835EF46|nr:ParA family protein [Janibacter terrae]